MTEIEFPFSKFEVIFELKKKILIGKEDAQNM